MTFCDSRYSPCIGHPKKLDTYYCSRHLVVLPAKNLIFFVHTELSKNSPKTRFFDVFIGEFFSKFFPKNFSLHRKISVRASGTWTSRGSLNYSFKSRKGGVYKKIFSMFNMRKSSEFFSLLDRAQKVVLEFKNSPIDLFFSSSYSCRKKQIFYVSGLGLQRKTKKNCFPMRFFSLWKIFVRPFNT